jgi:2-polyprenyl-3-methyl-5-hydroxy-6-metoxy-1,4-benzoquinol methylase
MTTQPNQENATEALVNRLFDAGLKAFELLTVYVGDRLGLYKELATSGPGKPGEIASRAGLTERYVREWLEQQAVAGILTVNDPDLPESERVYSLSPEHAEALVDLESPYSITPLARLPVSFGLVATKVLDAFRSGGGVDWAAYGPDAIEAQGDFNRPWLKHQLTAEYLPALPDVHTRLSTNPPARVLDMACGVGWCGISIAKGYPNVAVTGIDIDESSITLARRNAESEGVADRVVFEARDGNGELGGPYDVALIIEAVHDVSNPVGLLSSVRQALAPGGSLVVVDERVAPKFTAPGDEIERFMYSASVLCCLPTGMSEQPSAATGTVMRPSTLEGYARKAGFRGFEILEALDHPFFRFYRLTP